MVRYEGEGFDRGGADAIAWPAPLALAGLSVVRRRRPRIDLVVDLGEDIGSARWCRGAATLGAMVAALLHVAPGLPVRSHATPVAVPEERAPLAVTHLARQMPAASAPSLDAPQRLAGTAGPSLYASLRAAGASVPVATDALAALGTRIDLGTIVAGDRFDIVVPQDGRLLYVGVLHDGEPLGLMRWTLGGREQWLDAAGTGAPSDGFIVPVADARLSSGFGMRFHPVLGFSRMHQGIDLAAPLGTPIVAAAEGIVRFAGGRSGYGNFVQVEHDGGMGSGYGHMADIVVRPGQMVRQGQLIGHVGSTGLSTGPHCHFEIYRNGAAIDPVAANYAVEAQLGGEALQRFRSLLARVVATPRG